MTTKIRTRFAPSPTGHLHIGGARTALFNWLLARHNQGTFILRIEDTDQERSSQEYVDTILAGMHWLGLDYDEGPFYQTQRFPRYLALIEKLLAEDKAYRCICSKERLETLRKMQEETKQKPRYDGHCRDLNLSKTDAPFVVRFRNPNSGYVIFKDMIRGKISVANTELDDLIILRSDGTPTYNFTVVVDDADMQITHVVRGDDHINNTPRQINILSALNVEIPAYAHVPMILGPDGKRLSKRHGAMSVLEYREKGFLPEALLNYLVRLGFSSGNKEIFSTQEMMELFRLEKVSRSPAIFNQEKLLWLNQHYIKTLPVEKIKDSLQAQFKKIGLDIKNGPDLEKIIQAQKDRCKTLEEIAEKSRYFFEDFDIPETLWQEHLTEKLRSPFATLELQLQSLPNWEKPAIHASLHTCAEKYALKLGDLGHPLRVVLTGTSQSPPIDLVMELLGKEKTLVRLKRAITWLK